MSKVFFTNSYQGRSFVVTPDLGFNPLKERDGNCLRAKKKASRKCPQTATGPEKDSATRLHISHHLQMSSNKKNQFFLVDLILAMALAKSGYVGLYRNYHPCGGTVCARPACFGTLIQRLLVSVRLGSLGCPKFFKEDVPSGKLT